jgi:hypothetical protein
MGNNEFPPPPPPPPPGQPNVPPVPPAGPTPQTPPAQVPPVQGFPPTEAYPQQAPLPQAAPPGDEKNRVPWIIAGVVAVVAVVIGLVLTLGGDDDTATLGGGDTEITEPEVDDTTASESTEGATTVASTDDTLVITAPETTQPAVTVAPTVTVPAGDGVVNVTDDTGSFSLFLPDTFETDTAPIDAQGVQFAQISGSDDLQAYVNDHDTFGITVLTAPADQVATPAELVGIFDPGVDVCSQRVPQSGYTTALGAGELLLLDGCGTGGVFAKVILVVPIPDQNAVIVSVAQGPGPANASLLEFTQAVTESVSIV